MLCERFLYHADTAACPKLLRRFRLCVGQCREPLIDPSETHGCDHAVTSCHRIERHVGIGAKAQPARNTAQADNLRAN